MGQPVGGVILDVVEVQDDVDGHCQHQDEERQDVDVDGEALRGHVAGEKFDPGE